MYNIFAFVFKRGSIGCSRSNISFTSIVPKCNSSQLSFQRLIFTNSRGINPKYNSVDAVNTIYDENKPPNVNKYNFIALKVRHISVDQTPVKSNGIYDRIIACGRLMRLHSLIPVVIFALPPMWSVALALPPVVTLLELKKIALICLGSLFARSAGCCVNDLLDRNFDRQVERTKTRPLASGSIGTKEALITLGVNSSAALAILFQFDPTTISLGLLTGLSCSVYPLMKRFTNYPQLILGLSSSIGVLMGWTAISGNPITVAPVCIYLASSIWSLIYDTVYAHQDKEFDKKLGLKSLALHWGDDTKKMCRIVAYNMSILMATCGYFAKLSDLFYASVVLSHLWMLREIKNVDLESPQSCFLFFKRSIVYGVILLSGILLGRPGITVDLSTKKVTESGN